MSLTLLVQSKRPVRWLVSKFSTGPSHRDHLGRWLNNKALFGAVAEVGCNDGAFAKQVLRDWEGRHYIMIDPWEEQPRDIFKEVQGYQYQTSFEKCSQMAEEDGRITIMRKFSSDAVKQVSDGHLDCCYLDGNHAYESVMQDLTLWWPKVRQGGLLGGHDYYNYTRNGHWCEVKKALDEWASHMRLHFHVTPCTSWWITK